MPNLSVNTCSLAHFVKSLFLNLVLRRDWKALPSSSSNSPSYCSLTLPAKRKELVTLSLNALESSLSLSLTWSFLNLRPTLRTSLLTLVLLVRSEKPGPLWTLSDFICSFFFFFVVVATLKFAILEKVQPKLDTILGTEFTHFLALLKDDQVEVRHATLLTFNYAIHHKPRTLQTVNACWTRQFWLSGLFRTCSWLIEGILACPLRRDQG